MAVYFCKKCGRRLPDGCSDKYCEECRKKREKTFKIVKTSVIVAATAAGAIYVWESQPEYMRKLVKRSVSKTAGKVKKHFGKKADEARKYVSTTAAGIEKKSREILRDSKAAKELEDKGRKLLAQSEEKGRRVLAQSEDLIRELGNKASVYSFKF